MDHLTPDQRSAVTFDRRDPQNLLILACAGSGKTETLACRVAQMVADGIDRSSIVAFTFTEHAATELKHRIRRKVEEETPDEPSLGEMFVGTIHSYCLRVLREHKADYRVFEVMDETKQAALIAANFVRFQDGNGIGLDRLRSRTRSGTYGETLTTFLRTLNVIHQQQIDIDAVGDMTLSRAVTRYREIAHGAPNYFSDFNDIIDRMISFLEEDTAALEAIRGGLTHLFVDEYQDVDDRQENLIALLTDGGRGPTLTVVGDDDQALYGFRGAKVRNIIRFRRRYPDVHRVILQQNFRSTHAIVEIADRAVRRIPTRVVKEPEARWRTKPGGPLEERMAEPGDIVLATFASETEEAEWVADRIEALRGVPFAQRFGEKRGLDYGDMAILLRSVRGAGSAFADVLRSRGVPVVVTGTGGLFGNDEVRLVQAAFSLLARADFATYGESRRVNLLSTAQTREFIRKAVRDLRTSDRLGPSANATSFLTWIARKRAELDRRAVASGPRSRGMGARIYPQQIFQEMLKELGAEGDGWPPDTMYNLGAFSNLVTQFESVHQWITPARLKSLVLFLSNWAMRNVDEGGVGELSALNSVKIMTVHAAKGLEWPVVFLPRISSRVFPSSLRTRPPETFLPTDSYDASGYVGGDDGERRLWYVALTRCEKYLCISSLERRGTKPTGYFKEVQHDYVCGPDRDPPRLPEKVKASPPAGANVLHTTYTAIAAFRRCEREFQLRTLMDFRPGVSEQFGYGQRIHDILAELHQKAIAGESVTRSDVRTLVEERFHLRYTRGRPYEILKETAIKALERYVERARCILGRALASEKPFELIDHDSEALVSGVVDLLESREDESLLPSRREIVGLVDFKASRIDTLEAYREIEESVRDQLQLYAVGVKYAFDAKPTDATARIISARGLKEDVRSEGCTEWIDVPVDAEAQNEASRKLASTIGRIRKGLGTGDFPTTGVANRACGKCDFRTFCSGYRDFRLSGGSRSANLPAEEIEEQTDGLVEDEDAWPAPE